MTLANFERSEVQAFGPSVFFPTHRFLVVILIDDHKQNVPGSRVCFYARRRDGSMAAISSGADLLRKHRPSFKMEA